MFLIDKIAEEKIQQALAEGQFQGVAGKGKPYRFDGYLYDNPQDRIFKKILKDHNFLPLPLQIRKDIERLMNEIERFIDRYLKIYSNGFENLISNLGIELPYSAMDYHLSLKRHQSFVARELPIWLKLHYHYSLHLQVRQFNRKRAQYRAEFLELIVQLNEMIEAYNEETIKALLKERDRFRISTTMGIKKISSWEQYFDELFPQLPEIQPYWGGKPYGRYTKHKSVCVRHPD